MTALLLENLKQGVASFELVPASGGCFEVTVDGALIYSKLETEEFPDEQAILDQISEMVA